MSQNCMDEGPNNETIKISIFHKFQHLPFWYVECRRRQWVKIYYTINKK